MDRCLGEVVDDQEESSRAARRAARAERRSRRAQAREQRQRLAATIMAARNSLDVMQFKEVFPDGTIITNGLIIWWARDRTTFHRYQVTRARWSRILDSVSWNRSRFSSSMLSEFSKSLVLLCMWWCVWNFSECMRTCMRGFAEFSEFVLWMYVNFSDFL